MSANTTTATLTISENTQTPIETIPNENTFVPVSSSHFSYFIRPSTPCILGQEDYDDRIDEDEFFLTAGGIVHSCPNIYELSNNDNRKLQSCDHLFYADHSSMISADAHHINDQLNIYDTGLDRYSIFPRFHTTLSSRSSSISHDSMNSDLQLYKIRHATGLSGLYCENLYKNSSYLPTIWKSENHLLLPLIDEPLISVSQSIDQSKRSRSHGTNIEHVYRSLVT